MSKNTDYNKEYIGGGRPPNSENIWVNSELDTHIDIPESSIETADESVFMWFRDVMKSPGILSQGKKVRVIFSSGERWALNLEKNSILSRDGRAILPVLSITRNNITWGNTVERRAYNGNEKQIIKINNDLSTGKKQYIEMAAPIPFEVDYTFRVWAETQIEVNKIIMSFWESIRNRNHRETIVVSRGGWSYYLVFNDAINIGENLDDFSGSERIIRADFSGKLTGYHIRGEDARVIKYNSINAVSFGGYAKTDPEMSETARRRRRDVLPSGIPEDRLEDGYRSALEPLKGKFLTQGMYNESDVIQTSKAGRAGERIFKIVKSFNKK